VVAVTRVSLLALTISGGAFIGHRVYPAQYCLAWLICIDSFFWKHIAPGVSRLASVCVLAQQRSADLRSHICKLGGTIPAHNLRCLV